MSGRLALLGIVNTILTVVRNVLITVAVAALGLYLGQVLGTGDVTWPITLVGLAFYAFIIFANPLAGLLFWVVTAPFSRFVYLDIVLGRGIPDLTLTRICAGMLLVVVLARMAVGRLRAPRLAWLDAAVLATLIGIGASLPSALDGLKQAVTSFGDAYLVPAIIYLLARCLVRERRNAESVGTALIALSMVLTSAAAQEQLMGQSIFLYSERSWVYTKDIHKLAGLLGSPAFFGALLPMPIGFLSYRLLRADSPAKKAVCALLLVYVAVGVYFTFNRAAWLSLVLCLVMSGLLLPGFRRLVLVGGLVAVVAVVASWNAIQQSPVVSQRLTARGPVEYRLEIWSRAGSILAHNPIFGLGYGNFGRVYLKYNPSWRYATVLPAPHNSVLEVLFSSGLVGAIPYVATVLIIAAGLYRFYRREAPGTDEQALVAGFIIALVPYVMEALVIDMVAAYYVNMVMMLVVGSVFGWQVERQRTAA